MTIENKECQLPTPLSDAMEVRQWGCVGGSAGSTVETVYELCRHLERALAEARISLSNAVTERDEAREHADSFICGCLDSGAELPNKSGWMRNGEEDEGTFVYAAKRGLIERHPTEPLYFKFTEAGKELA